MKKTYLYSKAGVSLKRAALCVEDIASRQKRTEGRFHLSNAFGQFTANCDLSGYATPVIAASCDGIGTKLQCLIQQDRLEDAGADLVAMNVNDVLTANADPLMFLDYIAMPRLERSKVRRLIKGMTHALASCGCLLGGGELAEMPGLSSLELSGFCVGVAEKEDVPDISTIRPGDRVYGLPSNGFHANGFSLIRQILADHPRMLKTEDQRLLLKPSRLYHAEVHMLKREKIPVKGMAHITGGGLPGNLRRILGPWGARLTIPPWRFPPAKMILSHVTEKEALRVFNLGIGWVIITAAGGIPSPFIRLGEVTRGSSILVKVAS